MKVRSATRVVFHYFFSSCSLYSSQHFLRKTKITFFIGIKFKPHTVITFFRRAGTTTQILMNLATSWKSLREPVHFLSSQGLLGFSHGSVVWPTMQNSTTATRDRGTFSIQTIPRCMVFSFLQLRNMHQIFYPSVKYVYFLTEFRGGVAI